MCVCQIAEREKDGDKFDGSAEGQTITRIGHERVAKCAEY